MIQALLFLLEVSYILTDDCPRGFSRFGSETCLHLSYRPVPINNRQAYCDNEAPSSGGKAFGRPISAQMWNDMNQYMLSPAVSTLPFDSFLGIKKVPDSNPYSPNNLWAFTADGKEFKTNDYPLWSRKPMGSNEECVVIAPADQFKVNPAQCGVPKTYVCEKKSSPCEIVDSYWYVDYFNRCLFVCKIDDTFSRVEDACPKGYLIPLKSALEMKSVKPAFLNSMYLGGVYIGLMKVGKEKWVYDNQSEETERWDPDYPTKFDCGVIRLLEDGSLGLYTMDCKRDMLFFCEISGSIYSL